MIWRIIFILSLLAIDVGVFLLVVAYLPRSSSFGWSTDLEYYVRSRGHWDIAKTVLVAAVIISAGVYGLVEARVQAKRSG